MILQANASAEGVGVFYKFALIIAFERGQKPRPFESKDTSDSESSTLEILTTTLSCLCFSAFFSIFVV